MKHEVLVVDDDDILLKLHKILLAKNGIEKNPLLFIDGKQVYEYLISQKEVEKDYIMFLDINMPIMNGWNLLDKLKESGFNKKLLVIIVTSSTDSADKDKAKQYSEIIYFIEKPFSKFHIKKLNEHELLKEYFNA